MNSETELRHKIIFEFLEKVKSKYPIVFWGVSGSTARGDFSPGSDIDLVIELEALAKAESAQLLSRSELARERWI